MRIHQMKTPQYRQLHILGLVVLGVCAGMAGTAVLARWQAERAMGADAQLLLQHGARQVEQTLQGWRKTVVLFRDAVDKASALGEAERAALARSVSAQHPHMLGIGWLDRKGTLRWWTASAPLGEQGLTPVGERVREKAWLHNLFSVSSAWAIPLGPDRPVLALVEPLRARANKSSRIIAVFDISPMLEEAVGARPAQLIDAGQPLCRSARWRGTLPGEKGSVQERAIRFPGLRWELQTQRGGAAAFPLLWFVLLLAAAGLGAALASAGICWAAERLRRLATTDELTGLPNRRHFMERWGEEFERARRYDRDLACLMIDVNGFKRVNDLLGHSTGDRILRQVAGEVKGRLRQSDIVARFGGDEFAVALPETDPQQAIAVAQKLRQVSIGGFYLRPVRLSVGVSHRRMAQSAEEVLRRADADLYASRRAGYRPGAEIQLATGTYGAGDQRGDEPHIGPQDVSENGHEEADAGK